MRLLLTPPLHTRSRPFRLLHTMVRSAACLRDRRARFERHDALPRYHF